MMSLEVALLQSRTVRYLRVELSRIAQLCVVGSQIETSERKSPSKSLGVKRCRPPPAVMSNDHPPAMLPGSGGATSTTYKDHVPFGSVPLKAEASVADPPSVG